MGDSFGVGVVTLRPEEGHCVLRTAGMPNTSMHPTQRCFRTQHGWTRRRFGNDTRDKPKTTRRQRDPRQLQIPMKLLRSARLPNSSWDGIQTIWAARANIVGGQCRAGRCCRRRAVNDMGAAAAANL